MDVICEMMRLKPESVKDYVNLHNDTWPELVKVLRQSGFIEVYVYILDNLVMVIMKCENFKEANKKAEKTEVFKKWDLMVREMLISDESFFHVKDVLLDLEPIWRLDNFDDNGILKL